MKHTFKFFGGLAATMLSVCLLLSSCKKEASGGVQENVVETQIATEDDAQADRTFDGVFDNVVGVDEEVGVGTGVGIFDSASRISGCFTVTRVPNTPGVFPKTITIDFGAGCTDRFGVTRKGKIITVYSGRMIAPGSEAVTTFNGYYVDSVHVEGTHKLKNNSTGTSRVFTKTIINGKLSKPGGNYINWDATHTMSQTAGLITPLNPMDDEFDITGFAAGQSQRQIRNVTWSRLIVNPLHKKFTCRWFGSGTVRITRNNFAGILNYGNGSCDNSATLTSNGNTYNITLH